LIDQLIDCGLTPYSVTSCDFRAGIEILGLGHMRLHVERTFDDGQTWPPFLQMSIMYDRRNLSLIWRHEL